MIRELTRADIEDILYGATLLGAGGGGELAEGLELIDAAIAHGKRFRMMALADAPDDALIGTPYLLGAISDLPERAPVTKDHPSLAAARRMAQHLGAPIAGFVPCELGGSNTAVPFFVAAMEDALVIDADPAGRAVPEITHSSYYLAGLPASPIVAANARGEAMLLEHIADDARAEEVVRALCEVSGNDIAAIDHVLPASRLRGAILEGTLSVAGALGKLWREARVGARALPGVIAQAAGGAVLFEGVVAESSAWVEAGFTVGSFEIDGAGAYEGARFRVALKNENMAGWRDGVLVVSIPEIITVLDLATGDVVTNPHACVGQQVAVIVLPAPEIFLSAAGLAAFGPAYAGLDGVFESALPQLSGPGVKG